MFIEFDGELVNLDKIRRIYPLKRKDYFCIVCLFDDQTQQYSIEEIEENDLLHEFFDSEEDKEKFEVRWNLLKSFAIRE